MPRCIKCGNVYSSKYISGVCNECAGLGTVKPAATAPAKRSDSSSSEINLERYEEEVARVSKAAKVVPKRRRNRGFNAVTLSIFLLLCTGGLALTYIGFGLTRHFAIWSIALMFFFLGAAMIVTKRLVVGRSANADLHAAASVGGLCLLPLVMCTFYYSFSLDLPSDRALWMVGGMCFLAFLALAGVAFGLSQTVEVAE
jgi:hypothetical protein